MPPEDGIDLGKKRNVAFEVGIVRRPGDRAVRVPTHRADERWVGKPGVLGDYEFWIVIQILGSTEQQEGIRRIGRRHQNIRVSGLEPLHLRG
jgi:hypothetical protein